MKSIFSIILVFLIMFTNFSVFAVNQTKINIIVNNVKIQPKNAKGETVDPFIKDGSAYLPIRAIADALSKEVFYDDNTKSIFIGLMPSGNIESNNNDNLNIYIDGKLFIPKDVLGNEILPIVINGTTYLPVRAVSEAFSKKVDWYEYTNTIIIKDVDSKDIFNGAYYKILKHGTNLALTVENSSKEDGANLIFTEFTGDKSQLFGISHIRDGYYTIINMGSGKAVDVPSESKESGTNLITWTRNGNKNQQWFFKKVDSSYKIISNVSSLYLDASLEYVKQEEESDEGQLFDIFYESEPLLDKVLDSDGFKELSENEQRAFKAYLFTDIDFSKTVAAAAEALLASSDYYSLDKDTQAEVLRKCMKNTAYFIPSGNVNLSHKSDYIIEGPFEVEEYYRWGGSWEPGYGYSITFDNGKHKITMYCPEDNENAKLISENVAESLSNFPYEFRKFVTTVYYDPVDANTYNGAKRDLWLRINYIPTVEASTQVFAHELGHVIDYNTDGDTEESYKLAEKEWYDAIALDIVPVSGYGNTNKYEDLAEFSRLFFISYDKPELLNALKVVYPNRYEAFINMLHRADSSLIEFTEKLK